MPHRFSGRNDYKKSSPTPQATSHKSSAELAAEADKLKKENEKLKMDSASDNTKANACGIGY